MKKRKLLLGLLSAFVLTSALGVAACEPTDQESGNQPTQMEQIYAQYIVYAQAEGITPLSYEEWLETVKGEKGDQGEKGDKGDKGDQGATGEQGPQGEQGVGIQSITINEDGDFVVTYTDGTTQIVAAPNKHTHSFDDWVCFSTNDASCEDRLFYRICETCNSIEWKQGTYDDHDFTIVITAPTCTEEGATTYTCACGESYTEAGEPATGHAFVEGFCACGAVDPEADKTIVGSQGLRYELLNNDTYKVIDMGDCNDAELIIPETYKGKPVTAIGAGAFRGNKEIGLLEIPDSVTVIEDNAFTSCSRLEVVTMGNGVTSIGKEAFMYCDNLKAIRLSDSLTTIGDKAFYYSRKLQAISFPDSLEVIGKRAFEGAPDREVHNNLTTVNFGKGLRTIGEYAFYNCANLSDVIIPDGAPTAIGNNAFLNCSRIRVIELGNGVVSIGENAFSADELEEGGGLRVREVILGDSVRTIGAGAFKNCRKLVKVALGKGLQEIGNEAFYKCQLLREVINDSNFVIEIGSSDYGYVAQYAWGVHTSEEGSKISHDEQGLVYYTDGARKVLVTVILWDTANIVIPDDVTEISENACYNEQMLTGVVVGNGVTTIGSKAFGNCYNLRTLELGSSVTTIADYAFYNNVALSTVIFSTSVKTVGEGAFLKKEGWDGFKNYKVYYLGTKAEWDQITFNATKNDHLLNPDKGGKIGFYSEEQPTDTKNLYWRYVDGVPKFW